MSHGLPAQHSGDRQPGHRQDDHRCDDCGKDWAEAHKCRRPGRWRSDLPFPPHVIWIPLQRQVKEKSLHDGRDEEFDAFVLDEDKVCDELEDAMAEGGKVHFARRRSEITSLFAADNRFSFMRFLSGAVVSISARIDMQQHNSLRQAC